MMMLLDVVPPTMGRESDSLVWVLAILGAVAVMLIVRRALRRKGQ